MVYRDVKKALHLLRVQVHRQHAINPGRVKQVGNQFRGDWNPRLIFAVLTGVPKKWNDRGDSIGAGAASRVDHDEQLHQMLIARRRCRLNQKNVPGSIVLLDHHVSLAVGERADRGLAERDADIFANALGQLAIGSAAKNLHFWLKREHEGLNCRARSWLAMNKTCQTGGLSRMVL